MGGAGEAGSCELNEATGSDSGKGSEIVAVQRGRDQTADLGGGLEICEEGESVAGERRKKEEASEGGGEVGDAGVCIAACKFLASRRSVAHTSVDRQMFWIPSSSGVSSSLGAFVSVRLPEFAHVCQLVCVSVCQLGRCVYVHPQRVTPVMFDTLSATVCLTECFASARVNLFCPSVDLTESGEAVGKEEGVWRDVSPAEIRLGKTYWRLTRKKMWTEREQKKQ